MDELTVPVNQIRATTSLPMSGVDQSPLGSSPSNTGLGSWMPETSDQNPYIEVHVNLLVSYTHRCRCERCSVSISAELQSKDCGLAS